MKPAMAGSLGGVVLVAHPSCGDPARGARLGWPPWLVQILDAVDPFSYSYHILCIYIYAYGSIPINTNFMGMNIHVPAILMFTRGTRFWPIPYTSPRSSQPAKTLSRQPLRWISLWKKTGGQALITPGGYRPVWMAFVRIAGTSELEKGPSWSPGWMMCGFKPDPRSLSKFYRSSKENIRK